MVNSSLQNVQQQQFQNFGQPSGTTVFSNSSSLTNQYFIIEAYTLLGFQPDDLSGLQIDNALRSMNFMLSSWANKGIRQWMVKKMLVNVNLGQSVYEMVNRFDQSIFIDILDVSLRTQQRLTQLLNAPIPNLAANGVPFSSSGAAANAFDGNNGTACTQTSPDGYIGFNFNGGLNPSMVATYSGITMMGVMSAVNDVYTLRVETSADNANWETVVELPKMPFTGGFVKWIDISLKPTLQYVRVVETGGSTLNITELYFSAIVNDLLMTQISRSEYQSITNKMTVSARPNQYYFDKQVRPTLYLWPFPNTNFFSGAIYNSNLPVAGGLNPYQNEYLLQITFSSYMEDVGGLYNTLPIPSAFYQAFVYELAINLANKENRLDRLPWLQSAYMSSFEEAKKQNCETEPMRFVTDLWNNFYGNGMW